MATARLSQLPLPPSQHLSTAHQPAALTPMRKRRPRMSYSPPRNAPTSPIIKGLPKSASQDFEVTAGAHAPTPLLPTSSPDLEGFSFWGADGSLHRRNSTPEQKRIFEDHLGEHFGAVDIWYQEPYLLIVCDPEKMPPPEKLPFTVAGLVAVWRAEGDDDMDFDWVPGDVGGGKLIDIDEAMLGMIKHGEVFPDEVVLYLASEVFPSAEAITSLWTAMVVELPLVDEETHSNRLSTLPIAINAAPVSLHFHNGPLPGTPRAKRAVRPSPKYIDGERDETDYVNSHRKFYPGVMLSSVTENGETDCGFSAGILIEKDGERRLTGPFHPFEDQFEAHPKELGNSDGDGNRIYNIVQGTDPGTDVGFLHERVGVTNIGLMKLHDGVDFDTRFMDVDCIPQKMVKSEEQNRGDTYIFESWVTGTQRVVGLGERRAVGRRARHSIILPNDKRHFGPDPGVVYISARQGAYGTNTPVLKATPHIRDGVCGATLFRIRDIKNPATEDATMARGEVVAMLHFADLQLSTVSQGKYVIFADSFDPLIDAGWTVVQQPTQPAAVPSGKASPSQLKRKGSPQNGGQVGAHCAKKQKV